MEVYLAGRHGASLRDDVFWSGLGAPDWAYGELRKRAAEVASRHPSVSAADVSRAESVIAPQLEKIRRFLEPATVGGQAVSLMGNVIGIVIVIWSLIWSVILPGGPLLRAAGLAAVTRDGKQIGRLRAAVCVLTTWAPTIVWAWGLFVYTDATEDTFLLASWWVIALTLGPPALGALWTVTHLAHGTPCVSCSELPGPGNQ